MPKFLGMGCTRNVRGGLGHSSASLQGLGDTSQQDRGLHRGVLEQSHTSDSPSYLPLHCLQLQKKLKEACHTLCDSMGMGASITI